MKFIKLFLFILLAANTAEAQLSVTARIDHLNPDGIDSLGNIFLDVSGSTAPYTYSWSPGAATTGSLLSIPKNQYTVKVKSAGNDSLTYRYNVGYKVSWTNVEGYFGNDTLRGDACSKNTLLPNTDGWMEYVVSASYGYHYYMGFTDSLSPVGDLGDIDFGIYSYAGIYLYAYENGSTVLLSSQNAGDVVRIERKGDTINYKINEVLMRSVVAGGISSKTFKLRANINTPLGIANVGCSFMHTGGVAFDNYIKVKPVIVHSSNASSSNGSISVFPKLAGAYSYTWQPGAVSSASISSLAAGTYTALVQDSLANQSTYQYTLGYKTKWTNVDGSFHHDTLRGSACSKNSLLPNTNGWMQYVVSDSYGYHYYMGFTDSLSLSGDVNDIDFGIYSYAGLYLYAFESGYATLLTSQNPGDIIRIERKGDTVNYKINEVLMRSVVTGGTSSKTLKLRANINTPLGMADVGDSFIDTNNVTFPNYLRVHPSIIHSSGPGISNGSITAISEDIGAAYTYTWSPGSAHGASVINKSAGNYTLTVADTALNKSNYHYNIGYKVKWTNLYACTLSNDTLLANTGNEATAVSKNVLHANAGGWVEYIVQNTSDYKHLGFTDSLSPNTPELNDIRYGIYQYLGNLNYLSGGYTVLLASLKAGDVVRIERMNYKVSYLLNGALLYSLTDSAAYRKEWRLKTGVYPGNVDVNIGCSFSDTSNSNFPNYVRLYPSIIHSSGPGINDGSVSALRRDAGPAYTYTWTPGAVTGSSLTAVGAGAYRVAVKDTVQNQSAYSYHVGYKTKWVNLDNCSLSHDTLRATGGGWCTAAGKNVLPAGTAGWFEYVVQNTSDYKLIGLTDSISTIPGDYNDIYYGIYQSISDLYYFSHGYFSLLGYVQKGDVVRIERANYLVSYKLNGETLYSTTDSAAYNKDWRLKTAIYPGQSDVNIGCSFSTLLNIAIAKQNASAEDLRSGLIAMAPYGGTAPYTYAFNGDSSAAVVSGLAPGDYTVSVTDSTGDETAKVVSIGLQNSWRLQQHVSLAQDTINLTGTDTTGHLVSYNTIYGGEDGWTEITVGKKNQDFAFGFIGADSTEADTTYATPYTNDLRLGKKLAFADSLVYKEFAGTSYTGNAQFARTHVVVFHNGTATALFQGSARAAISYDEGDVFKLRRSAGTMYLEKNGTVVAQENASSNSQYLVSLITVMKAAAILHAPGSYGPNTGHSSELPFSKCLGNNYNWTYSRTFDETGLVKDEAKQYMDGLGRTIQSQSRLFSKNNTLVSEPIYDAFGRAVGQSLPAPSYNTDLCYIDGFITNTSGLDYSYLDHDKPVNNNSAGELYNPNPVDNTTQGRLGWYYSDNNTSESLVAASALPYSRVEFYNDPLGRPKKAGGVGADHKLGSGHETKYIYTSTNNTIASFDKSELAYVFPYLTYELAPDFTTPGYSISGNTSAVHNTNITLFKTIMLNADGKDQVSYTNSAGQVIATCISGDAGGCGQDLPVTQNMGATAASSGTQLYIPIQKTNTFKIYDVNASPVTITPVIYDILAGATLASGTDYTYNSSTGAVTFAGAYSDGAGKANRSLYLNVSYTSPTSAGAGHQLVAECKVNYTQWSLYFYDRKGRLLSNVSPNDVKCQAPPALVQRTVAHGSTVSTCDSTKPDLVSFRLLSGTGGTGALHKEGVLQIRPEAFAIDTSAVIHYAYDPVYKTNGAMTYADSVYLAGLSPMVLDTTATIIDSMYTNHSLLPPDSILAPFLARQNVLPQALAGKGIAYTGHYRIHIDSSATPLPQVIPFSFTVLYDGAGNPTIYNRKTYAARLDSATLTGASTLSVRAENVQAKLIGYSGDSLYNLCDASIPLNSAQRVAVTGMFAHNGIAANFSVLNYSLPNNLNFYTTYTYDEYDRLIASNTQDEGRVDYLYDQAEDKLFFTQNDKQRANGGKFSALLYDKLGRVVQTGEYDPYHGGPTSGGEVLQFQTYADYFKNSVAPATGFVSVGTYAAANASPYTWGHLFETNHIVYDTLDKSLPLQISNYAQRYTAAKVSKTWNDHDTTWYSYDDLGRQAWSVQYLDGLNNYKTMDYSYDFRGKVSKTEYQKYTSADKFTHLYSYDADERLSAAFVMRGASPTQIAAAAYQYYLHGPLKRSVLGNDLQGLDYVYTIGGQLKSLNNPMATTASQDPGQDSYGSGPNASVKADVFAYTLDYYNNDYVRSGSPIKPYNSSSYTGQNVSYAGLLKATRWKTTLPSGATDDYSGATRMYEYNYNDLYQFTGATFGKTAVISGNVTFAPTVDYGLSGLSYDDNGNLVKLVRNTKSVTVGTPKVMDDLSYNYHATKTNRLLYVHDAAMTSGIAADLDLADQSSGNYTYNQIGEMTANAQEDRGYEYNASGLCTRAYVVSTGYDLATFEYNDKGMRHSKTSYDNTGTASKVTWYVYDAGGAQVATYEKDLTITGSSITLKDLSVYAAGRLGVFDATAAKIFFELSDHLGNTRALVTETSGATEVMSFTDYYPHGGVMPGQNYVGASAYRYGYQGQEKDPETGLVNFELRQYDPRIARWYNPDPMGQHHSPYLAMGNNPVSFTDEDGGWDFDGAGIGGWQAIVSNSWNNNGANGQQDWIHELYSKITSGIQQQSNSFGAQSAGEWNEGRNWSSINSGDRSSMGIAQDWTSQIESQAGRGVDIHTYNHDRALYETAVEKHNSWVKEHYNESSGEWGDWTQGTSVRDESIHSHWEIDPTRQFAGPEKPLSPTTLTRINFGFINRIFHGNEANGPWITVSRGKLITEYSKWKTIHDWKGGIKEFPSGVNVSWDLLNENFRVWDDAKNAKGLHSEQVDVVGPFKSAPGSGYIYGTRRGGATVNINFQPRSKNQKNFYFHVKYQMRTKNEVWHPWHINVSLRRGYFGG